MQIQVNTDHNIEGREQLTKRVEAEVHEALGHLTDQITRVEVHINDMNGSKSGGDDKRCMMEARIAGHQPLAASHHAESLEQAVDGAAKKLRRVIEHTVGRLSDSKGRASIRTDMDEMPADESAGPIATVEA